MSRIFRILLAAALPAALLAPTVATAYVNPSFTPVHLTFESNLIVLVKTDAKVVGDTATLTVAESLKGKAPAAMAIDLTTAINKQQTDAARTLLANTHTKTLMLFAGKYQHGTLGYLHVAGKWLKLQGTAEGKWQLIQLDPWMLGTWNGATEMLIRCTRYVLKQGRDAVVRATEGTEWADTEEIGTVDGKVAAALAVDLKGDGKLTLHIASTAGDKLFRFDDDQEAFAEVTATHKLVAKSRAAVWVDLNGDGRVDLASFDGKQLTIHSQNADGTFTAAKAGGEFTVPADCNALAVIGLGKTSTPALVIPGLPPTLLKSDGKNGFTAVALKLPAADREKVGKPQTPIVADFNDDGLPDLLLPCESDGFLFAGTADGTLAAGVLCGVGCMKGGGKAAVGDFDGDGWMDVITAGVEGVQIFQNLHNGRFAETMMLSGEFSYKDQAFAVGCGVGDFNNDGRQDAAIIYESQGPLIYFNRGWRSFAEAPKLEMALAEGIEDLHEGQQAAALLDFDDDGAQDLVIVDAGGKIFCSWNDLGGDGLCLKARLPAAAKATGPVTVKASLGERLLGAFQTTAGGPPAFIGLPDAAEVTLHSRLAGGPVKKQTVEVEDEPVDVVLNTTP